MEEAVVLYPSPHIGHLISMVEFGKLLLTHKTSLYIHILIAAAPYTAGKTDSYITTVSATIPSIKFHHLPVVAPVSTAVANHEELTLEVLELTKPYVHEELVNITKSYKIHGLIMDFFCTSGLSVAKELNIPGYFFITCGACFLACFLYFPTLHQITTKSFKDMKQQFLDIPGLPPVLATDLPKPLLDREDRVYLDSLDFATQFPQAAGIMINTFELLESKVVKSLSDGLCVPNNRTPPISCIGPLIVADDKKAGSSSHTSPDEVHECITWLDSQPSQSVVFLCFGSLGLFSREQLREIAIGLERSGQRFLWVVRNPPTDGNLGVAIKAQEDPDLDSLLPDGFLERTKEIGFVVKSWAPQVAILNHGSVGGFVTHCGWNSTLETVCAGLPMVAWPLYAEQRLNRVVLVEEMKLALSMNESEDGFVSADEVEKKVRGLMEFEEGKSIRERATAMKIASKAAMEEGGSSHEALSKLLESWN